MVKADSAVRTSPVPAITFAAYKLAAKKTMSTGKDSKAAITSAQVAVLSTNNLKKNFASNREPGKKISGNGISIAPFDSSLLIYLYRA